jgi:hypothetical protein
MSIVLGGPLLAEKDEYLEARYRKAARYSLLAQYAENWIDLGREPTVDEIDTEVVALIRTVQWPWPEDFHRTVLPVDKIRRRVLEIERLWIQRGSAA